MVVRMETMRAPVLRGKASIRAIGGKGRSEREDAKNERGLPIWRHVDSMMIARADDVDTKPREARRHTAINWIASK